MQTGEPLQAANTRVLVVEDSPITAKMTQDMLMNLGFTVSIVSSGMEALQRVREAPPDLILMDIILKGELDGIETAKRIHTQFDIPVIYLTSFSEEKVFQRAKNTAPFGYLIKARMTNIELHRAVEIALYKHKTDKTIREFQKLIEKTLETSFDGIAVLDFEGTILLVNEALASMSGYSKVELTGLHISKITVGPDFTTHLIRSAKKDNKIINFETAMIPSKTQPIPVALSSGPIREEEKILVVFRDLREKKQLSEEIKLFREFTENHIRISLFKLGSKGPTVVTTESLPLADDFEETIFLKMGVYYITALGQGNTPKMGLYGPLPAPELEDYMSMVFSFIIGDRSSTDPRTYGKTYAFIVLTIPEGLVHLFSNRAAVTESCEDMLRGMADIRDIDLNMLKSLKHRILAFDEAN